MEEQNNAGLWRSSAFPDLENIEPGLTKLEIFTMSILSGFVANPALAGSLGDEAQVANLISNAIVVAESALEACEDVQIQK